MPSESGYIRLRVATTSGPVMPSRSAATLADGDDGGRAVTEQRAADEGGHRPARHAGYISEHNSTDTSAATSSGAPRR